MFRVSTTSTFVPFWHDTYYVYTFPSLAHLYITRLRLTIETHEHAHISNYYTHLLVLSTSYSTDMYFVFDNVHIYSAAAVIER